MLVVRAPAFIEEQLRNAHYGIFNHSAVEICTWTKKSLKDPSQSCYKNKFYGIDSHRCMQMTQAVAWCTNRCIYCWRPMEFFVGTSLNGELDPPEVTMEKLREQRKKLLTGFGGNPNIDKKRLEEAMEPTHITFSLMGEPLLYPYVPEAIEYVKKHWPWVKSIFVVTSGQVPEAIERMIKENKLPTQLYVSFTGPDKETYFKVSRPAFKDYWERFLKTLDLLRDAPVRKVARLTLIKGVNDINPEGYASLIERMNPHFVEVKAYMYLGFSRRRLEYENMPSHSYVREFSFKLLEYLPGYEYMDEDEPSRVVVLKNRREGMDIDPIITSPDPSV